MFGGETIADSHARPDPLRAGPPAGLLLPARGRARGPPRAVRHAHDLPAQGRGELLLGPRRRPGRRGRRLALPRADRGRAPTSRATSPSTGTRWTPGGRRTTRSSSTRATRTTASTCCAARATSRVELDGTVVAETDRPLLLVETGLPPRWYIPRADVRLDLLTPTDTQQHVPVQGRRELLHRDGRRHDARGHRLELPRAAARVPEDRAGDVLLQRARHGHAHRRRRGRRAPRDALEPDGRGPLSACPAARAPGAAGPTSSYD